jgi:predicted metal-dependent peptidase
MDDDGLGNDVIPGTDLSDAEIKEIEANAKVEIAEAAQAAKMRGKLSGVLEKIVCDVLNVKTPWYELLEIYMADKVANDYSWSRPNRRFIGQDMYLPSVSSQNTMGEVVIQIDVSGSVSETELKYYNGHLSRIVEQCAPEKVHVIYTDTEVKRHDVFERGEDVALEYFSGGGTDMCEGYRYIAEQGIEPEVVITLTDGFTPFPKSVDWPSVWCISSDIKAPDDAGLTVHFELEQQ